MILGYLPGFVTLRNHHYCHPIPSHTLALTVSAVFLCTRLVVTQQWISWIVIISPEVYFIYRAQIQPATIKRTTHSLKKWLTEMDQAIMKITVLIKNLSPQKFIIGLPANIWVFIKVAILKKTEISEN